MGKSSLASERRFGHAWFACSLAAILLLAVLPFAAIVDGGFLGDDFGRVGVAARHADRPFAFVRDALLAPREIDSRYFRPVYEASYLVDVALFGLRPAAFHAVDVLLHYLASILAALLALRIWSCRRAAWLAGLCFAWLPVHVESVAWISARDSQLALLFGGLAVLLATSPARGARGAVARVCGAMAFGVAYLSRESAVVIPAAVALVAWARAGADDAPATGARRVATPRARTGRAVAAVLPTAVALLLLTALRLRVFGIGSAQQVGTAPPDLTSALYWSSRLDMLRLLVAPARGDRYGPATIAGIAAPALLLIALACAGRARRATAIALAAWLLACLVPLHWSTVDPATLLNSRNLYEPSLPAILLLAGGLVPALPAPLRRLRLGGVAVLIGVHLGLLAQNLAIHREGAEVSARMQHALLALAERPPRATAEMRTAEELPFEHRGVPVGSVIEKLLAPPWIEREPNAPVAIFTRRDRTALVGSYLIEQKSSAWSRFVWDPAAQALVKLERPAEFTVRGQLDADGEGYRLRCLDRALRIPSDVAFGIGGAQAQIDDVHELRVRELEDGSLHVLAARLRPATLAVARDSRPGTETELVIEVRARSHASVVVSWPGRPTLIPVHGFGAVLTDSTRVLAQGFADAAGRFSTSCRLPANLAGSEVRLQAILGDPSGWAEISECVCARFE